MFVNVSGTNVDFLLLKLFLNRKRRKRDEDEEEEEEDEDDDCDFSQRITCDHTSKFRTNDGSCNNLAHPYWGMAETPLVRFLCSAYDDGCSKT